MKFNSASNPCAHETVAHELRRLLMPWSFALLLPMPMLLATSDHPNSDIATLYLALGAAWLATEAFHPDRAPATAPQGRRRMGALLIYLAASGIIFTLLGLATGVPSNIPLPLLAAFGVAPSLGLVPWLTLKFRQPYAAIILGGLTVGLLKITGCIVARIVYGPDCNALGYVSADWQTAKLMISVTWAGTLLVSGLALVACLRRFTSPSLS